MAPVSKTGVSSIPPFELVRVIGFAPISQWLRATYNTIILHTLDKDKGIALVYFTQFLPFNDKESYDFYSLFEKEVYAGLETK